MEKVYEPINWENYPSVATPINEKNLNKMDSALEEVDNRVIGLDTAKLDKSTANTMVKDVSFDETTGIFTITYLNGTVRNIDTKLEKIAVNFSYDRETQKLLLTLVDSTEQEVDLSSLISQYEFTDSDYITFEVGNDGKIKATIKSGSITEDMLQPNFLADVRVESEKAKSSANSASNSADEAKQYRNEAEQIKREIEAVTGVEIATTEKAGIVKPDGETITIDNDGTIRAKVSGVLDTLEEVEANEEENKTAGALALKKHSTDKENPHGVTAEQVGLGNVPNVATNNQTPTYTMATSLATLKSGEKLSVAFGKIAKAISGLISHLSDKNNPHGVTAEQIGIESTTVRYNDETGYLKVLKDGQWIETNVRAYSDKIYLVEEGINNDKVSLFSGGTLGMSGDKSNASLTANSDGSLKFTVVFTAGFSEASLISNEMYDLTYCSKIVLRYKTTYSGTLDGYFGSRLFVTDTKQANMVSVCQAVINNSGTPTSKEGIIELDISALEGQFFIGIANSVNGDTNNVFIYDWYIE